MMEDIVLLETKLARPECEVFRLQFAVGEFDMVVFDSKKGCCELYEIKHSAEIAKEQYRHLLDTKKCSDTEFRYGDIIGKYVIYRGNDTEVDGVKYLNVEAYLNAL
ncbi:MAG: ATP-binding protein, partial [Agathobacter sp.]